MPSAPAGLRRSVARAAIAAFLRPLRLVVVATLVAFARALGGGRHVPRPAPRNLPAEVERKR